MAYGATPFKVKDKFYDDQTYSLAGCCGVCSKSNLAFLEPSPGANYITVLFGDALTALDSTPPKGDVFRIKDKESGDMALHWVNHPKLVELFGEENIRYSKNAIDWKTREEHTYGIKEPEDDDL
jgi:hypothetical protein